MTREVRDTWDKLPEKLKDFFKDPKIYKRYYNGPLNASSIDKIWLNISAAQKRQVRQLFDTQAKNIKEAAQLTKKGYMKITDLADELGRTTSLELVQSMKNSKKFNKLFPNYLKGMITASNNSKWIKTTPSTLKKLKEWADDPQQKGLTEKTIKNVQTAFKDKKLMNYWKNWKPGTPVDQELIDSVHGKKGSAYTMMQLGRTLQGKEPIEGIKKNVALGNKIIQAVRYKAQEFGDWHTAAYKYAKQDMDTFLPPGKSGTTFGDYQRLITKALKDVGLEGFEVDEINALRSGVRGGTQPYSVFSQVLEGKYNRGLKRRFDSENAKNQLKLNKALSMAGNETIKIRPKGASNAVIMSKPEYTNYIIKLQNDQVDNFFTRVPELKNKISLPKFDLRDPQTVYGSRFKTLDPTIQSAILKNFNEIGYTIDVGKKALTQKELLNSIANLKPGSKAYKAICTIGRFEGGPVEECVNRVAQEPEKFANKFKNITAQSGPLARIKNAALGFLKSGGVKTFGIGAGIGAAVGLVKQFRNDDPTSYLSNEDQQKNMLVDMATQPVSIDTERPAILDYQLPALGATLAASTALAAPSTIKASKSRSLGIERKPPGIAKTGLRVLGRGLGVAASPALLAPFAAGDIASQIAEGDTPEDIATNPFNYLYPAFAEQTPKLTRGLPSVVRKIARLGLSGPALRILSRAGIGGFAASAAIQGLGLLDD